MESVKFDLAQIPLRKVNQYLHQEAPKAKDLSVFIESPNGAHAIASGLNAPMDVLIDGHAGYYAASMNQRATVTINGSAGTGVAQSRNDARRPRRGAECTRDRNTGDPGAHRAGRSRIGDRERA